MNGTESKFYAASYLLKRQLGKNLKRKLLDPKPSVFIIDPVRD